MTDHLDANQSLAPNQSIVSANGIYQLILQTDSNLVLYKQLENGSQRTLWASNTEECGAVTCIMQGDGNLVLSDRASKKIWSSNSIPGNLGARVVAVVQDDGNFVIRRALVALPGIPPVWDTVWASNTTQAGPAPYREFSFVLVSDVHVTDNNDVPDTKNENRGNHKDNYKCNQSLVKAICAGLPNLNGERLSQREIDFVMIAGDLTYTDFEHGDETSLNNLFDIFGKLNRPFHLATGNHDSPASKWSATNGVVKKIWEKCGYQQYPHDKVTGWLRGAYPYTFDFMGFHFVILCFDDGKEWRADPPYDRLANNIGWLEDHMSHMSNETPIVIMQHYGADSEDWVTQDLWDRYYGALRGKNIVAVLSGHSHSPNVLDMPRLARSPAEQEQVKNVNFIAGASDVSNPNAALESMQGLWLFEVRNRQMTARLIHWQWDTGVCRLAREVPDCNYSALDPVSRTLQEDATARKMEPGWRAAVAVCWAQMTADLAPRARLIIGVGTDNNLYVIAKGKESVMVPDSGSVVAVAVAADGSIWGLGMNRTLYRRARLTSAWEGPLGNGSYLAITGMPDGKLLGVGGDNFLYTIDTNGNYKQVPNSGSVVAVAATADGSIWGLGMNRTLFKRATLTSAWEGPVGQGSFTAVTAMSDGTLLAIGFNNHFYIIDTSDGSAKLIPEIREMRVTAIAAGDRVSVRPPPPKPTIVGVGMDHNLYTRSGLTDAWAKIPTNMEVSAVAKAIDGTLWGLGAGPNPGRLYCAMLLHPDWSDLISFVGPRGDGVFLAITAVPGGGLLGVGTNNYLYTIDGSGNYTKVENSGGVRAVAVAADGTIWGLGTDRRLLKRASLQDASWQGPLGSGGFLAITAVPDGGLLGVGTNNYLYTIDGSGNYTKVENSGSVRAVAPV